MSWARTATAQSQHSRGHRSPTQAHQSATAQSCHSHSTATAQSCHSHSTATAQPQHSHSTATAQSHHSHSTAMAQSHHSHSTATAQSRHATAQSWRSNVWSHSPTVTRSHGHTATRSQHIPHLDPKLGPFLVPVCASDRASVDDMVVHGEGVRGRGCEGARVSAWAARPSETSHGAQWGVDGGGAVCTAVGGGRWVVDGGWWMVDGGWCWGGMGGVGSTTE